ncbi:sensor histidine kinase [Undibacterium sp. TJN19]|uniref:sensor histidine kinase n=1 Tax=Undibacterium sp. TJN19 TaxID=3413055 RepID=UPI003BEF80A1
MTAIDLTKAAALTKGNSDINRASAFDASSNLLMPTWPWLPALAIISIVLFANLSTRRYAWLADCAALLSAFTVSHAGFCLAQRMRWLSHALSRWIVLAIFMLAALIVALHMEKFLWPEMMASHAAGLMPAMIMVFLFVTVLPMAIEQEVRHKAQASLQAEASKHQFERQMLEAKLAALQGQIEPHFLFNTLANTRALIHQDSARAEQMLNHLIAYLRAAMPDLRLSTTTLGQELDRAEAYLQIFQIRLGERFQFSVAASAEARLCLIPPLAVMSLVENAIKHGIEPQPGDVRIDIIAHCEAGQLQITVKDNGRGFHGELGSGVGLLNVQERLLALFGEQAELSLQPQEEGGVSAMLILPVKIDNESKDNA